MYNEIVATTALIVLEDIADRTGLDPVKQQYDAYAAEHGVVDRRVATLCFAQMLEDEFARLNDQQKQNLTDIAAWDFESVPRILTHLAAACSPVYRNWLADVGKREIREALLAVGEEQAKDDAAAVAALHHALPHTQRGFSVVREIDGQPDEIVKENLTEAEAQDLLCDLINQGDEDVWVLHPEDTTNAPNTES